MTGTRRHAQRPAGVRRALLVLLPIACLLLGAGGLGVAAAQDARPVRVQRPPATPATPPRLAAPVAVPRTTIGLCQCIADRSRRNISCLSSVEACQTTCATSHYSFMPDAPSCPVTAR